MVTKITSCLLFQQTFRARTLTMISIYPQHIAFQDKHRTGIIYDQGQFVHASRLNPFNTLAPFHRMHKLTLTWDTKMPHGINNKFKQFMYYTTGDFCKARVLSYIKWHRGLFSAYILRSFYPCHRPEGSWALGTRMLARACKTPWLLWLTVQTYQSKAP